MTMRTSWPVKYLWYLMRGSVTRVRLSERRLRSILTLKLDGVAQDVLLRAFNMHPWKGHVQHIDFQRVSKDKKIHMKVPLHFVNAEVSPGVKEQGGVPNHVINELNISCLPDDLPGFIEVDMGHLTIGHSIHVKDLKLPKGVEPVLHKDENPVVATVILPVLITEEEAVKIALKAVPGEVTGVAIEKKLGANRYVVEVLAKEDGVETDVIIDMETGKELATEK